MGVHSPHATLPAAPWCCGQRTWLGTVMGHEGHDPGGLWCCKALRGGGAFSLPLVICG